MTNLYDLKGYDVSTTHGGVVSLILILIILVPMLLSVAFMTIIERKVMGSMQRRIGPNVVGYYGVLQPFADALKLVVKEQVIPAQSSKGLFYLAPMISLIFSLLSWAVLPFGSGIAIADLSLGVLYSLAVSSIGVYGALFAGWAANSKYAFLGSLRTTAQMVSYELIFSTGVFTVILIAGSLNYTAIIESQTAIWFIVPLAPVFLLYLISAIAELNRTPFDLPEAESELVSGFMTEHSGMIFVFFFLAEYCGVVVMSTFSSILFLGGYGIPEIVVNETFINFQSIVLAVKALVFMFFFVWVRATFVRQRYDALMIFCWTQLLPMAIAFLVLVPSVLIAFDIASVY
uniref:NADH dehydrogenase subunit 1 n=1 Tax=Malassezia vespertilionis TaxID=2020962 RepID=UPI0030012D16|nr:NADH dehydrogenase subunit 1 [Malassezia vespertilionis]